MTERKPGTVSWETWTESQITRAQREGQFDDLPGTGKPIDLSEQHELAWLAKKLRDEQADPAAYLPPQLALAREAELAPERIATLRSERDVREYLGGLNDRIDRLHARPPAGPPVRVKLVDVESLVAGWRERRAATPTPVPAAAPPAPARRRRWFRRRVG